MSALVVHRYKIKNAVRLGYFERNRNESNNKNFCNKVKWSRPYKQTPISVCNEEIRKAKFYLPYVFKTLISRLF